MANFENEIAGTANNINSNSNDGGFVKNRHSIGAPGRTKGFSGFSWIVPMCTIPVEQRENLKPKEQRHGQPEIVASKNSITSKNYISRSINKNIMANNTTSGPRATRACEYPLTNGRDVFF